MDLNRRGMALGLVLWALVIGSAILTVAVFIGMQDRRAMSTGRRIQGAMSHAETGLADGLLGWTPGLLSRRILHPFDSLRVAAPGPGSPVWRGAIQRLNRGLYLVSVTAADPDPSSIATVATLSRLGWLVRVRPVPLVPAAALEAGVVRLDNGARIDGRGSAPVAGADCPESDTAVAGIAASDVHLTGSPVVEGSPAIVRTAVDTGFPPGREAVFDQLASQATIHLSAGTWSPAPSMSGGECDVSAPLNWGDPSDPGGPCTDYWPVVSVSGNVRIPGGMGHGILLVDGDLVIDGSFRFSGLILVRGGVAIGAPNASISIAGALIAGQVGAGVTPLSGISVTYSKCMVSNSLQSSGVLVPLRSRGWKQLF